MKSATPGMSSHIIGEVTTLSSCWKVKRTDGVAFHFTDHDIPLTIDIGDGDGEQTYQAESSYKRTAVKSDDTMAVDNLDIQGVLDSSAIDEVELRRGLFNFAEISIFMVNWADLSQGVIKMRKGWIGEVIVTPNGQFTAELRGLTQAFARNIGELFSPDCRADLGDSRCKVPVDPAILERATTYAAGDYVKTADALEVLPPDFLATFEGGNQNNLALALAGTLGALAARQNTIVKFGTTAIEFSPSASRNPSLSFVSYADNARYTLGAHDFTIEGWVRFKDLTDTVQTFASHWNATGNQKAWQFNRNGANLDFNYSLNGTASVAISKAATWDTTAWHHVAAVRKGTTITLFLDGVSLGNDAGTIAAGSIHDSTEVLRLGKTLVSGGDTIFNGFCDDMQITVGWAKYTAGFTPLNRQAALADTDIDLLAAALDYTAFNGTIWKCTTPGATSADVQPHYDIGDSPITDGAAVFTGEVSWTKVVTVSAVDGASPRKKFSVTELTPPTGGTIPGKDFFPDDCMDAGLVLWTHGDNAGRAMEIREFLSADQSIEMYLGMPFDIQVGDVARVYRGCQKRRDEDCLAVFNNVINFRGEPDLPGQDALLAFPDARST